MLVWSELLDNMENNMPKVCECVYLTVKERNPESQRDCCKTDYFRRTGAPLYTGRQRGG